MHLSPLHRQILMDTARAVIRRKLAGDPPPVPSPPTEPDAPPDEFPDPALAEPAGCFVSLHALRTHRLRGCVGRLEAVDPLLRAVRAAALSVLSDPRFVNDPVRHDELAEIQLEISVLSPLRAASGAHDFDPHTEGIYLACQERTGCFLPQVARETGWSREQLLARLCTEKLGMPADAWRDPTARLQVFTTVVIGPEPFAEAAL